MAIRWDTRREFLRDIRSKHPETQGLEDQALYDQFVNQFPVYENQIAENFDIKGMPIPPEEQRKDWKDAFREKFTGDISAAATFTGLSDKIEEVGPVATAGLGTLDFFTGVPGLIETSQIYRAAKAVERGDATEQDAAIITSLAQDAKRPQSKGYKVWNTALEVPQYITAFILSGFGLSAAKKSIQKVISETGEFAGKKAVQKVATALGENAWKGGIKSGIKNLAIKAPVRGALMPQMWIDEQIQRMTPEFQAEQTDIDQFKLHMSDEGDDFWPALAKAYANTTIEAFSEETAEILPILGTIWGKKGAAPFKASILNRFTKISPNHTMKRANDLLRQGGWHGVLGEMFEERIGDVLRTVTPGVEGELIPSFDQLTTEALAFSIPGAAMNVAHYARGGEGLRQIEENEVLFDDLTKPVQTEAEFTENFDELMKRVETQSDPWYRGFKFAEKKLGTERRGSVKDILNRAGATEVQEIYEQAEAQDAIDNPAALSPSEFEARRKSQRKESGHGEKIEGTIGATKQVAVANARGAINNAFKNNNPVNANLLNEYNNDPTNERKIKVPKGWKNENGLWVSPDAKKRSGREAVQDYLRGKVFDPKIVQTDDERDSIQSEIDQGRVVVAKGKEGPVLFANREAFSQDGFEKIAKDNDINLVTPINEREDLVSSNLDALTIAEDGSVEKIFNLEGEDAEAMRKQLQSLSKDSELNIEYSVPSLFTGTREDFAAVEYDVPDNAVIWDTNENGDAVYGLWLGAQNNSSEDTITVTRRTTPGNLAEDTVEYYVKKSGGKQLPESVNEWNRKVDNEIDSKIEEASAEDKQVLRQIKNAGPFERAAKAYTYSESGFEAEGLDQGYNRLADFGLEMDENASAAMGERAKNAQGTFVAKAKERFEQIVERPEPLSVKGTKEKAERARAAAGAERAPTGEGLEGEILTEEQLRDVAPPFLVGPNITLFAQEEISDEDLADTVIEEADNIEVLKKTVSVLPEQSVDDLRDELVSRLKTARGKLRASRRTGQTIAQSPAKSVFEPTVAFAPEVADDISMEEEAQAEDAGLDIPAFRRKKAAIQEEFSVFEGFDADLLVPKSPASNEPMDADKPIGEQINKIIPVGMGNVSDVARSVSDKNQLEFDEFKPVATPLSEEQYDYIRVAGSGSLHEQFKLALHDQQIDADGFIVLFDNTDDTLDYEAGYPVMNIIAGAQTGKFAEGTATKIWTVTNPEGKIIAVTTSPKSVEATVEANPGSVVTSEIKAETRISQIDQPIGRLDYDDGAYRAIMPISMLALQNPKSVDKISENIRDFVGKNNIRNLAIVGLDNRNPVTQRRGYDNLETALTDAMARTPINQPENAEIDAEAPSAVGPVQTDVIDPQALQTPLSDLIQFPQTPLIDTFNDPVSNALQISNDIFDRVVPAVTENAPELRQKFVDADRIKNEQLNTAVFNVNKWERQTGLQNNPDHPEWSITDAHREKARNMYSGVTGFIEKTDNTIINGEQVSVADIFSEYNESAKNYPGMPTAEAIASEIAVEFEKARQTVNDELKGFKFSEYIRKLEDYVFHEVAPNTDQSKLEDYVTKYATTTKAAKERKYPSYVELAEAGFEIPSTDAALLYKRWNERTWRDTSKKIFFNEAMLMKDTDGSPFIISKPVKAIEIDEKTIKLKKFFIEPLTWAKYNDNMKTFAKEFNIKLDAEGMPDTGTLEQMGYTKLDSPFVDVGDIWVKAGEAERVVKDVLNYGKLSTPLVKALERFNAWSKTSLLTFSAFHHFSLMESFIAANGLDAGAKAIFHPIKTKKEIQSTYQKFIDDPNFGGRWIRRGLQVTQEDPNIVQGIVNNDIQKGIDLLTQQDKKWGTSFAEKGQKFFDMKKNWDRFLWEKMHTPMKLLVAERTLQELRENADSRGIEWTPEQEAEIMEQIASFTNNAFGGQEWTRYNWSTPLSRQMLHLGLFAPDWTFSSANISGLTRAPVLRDVLRTPKLSAFEKDAMLRKYWPAMIGLVLTGIPNAIQALVYAGFGDQDEGDVPFTFMNEEDRKFHIDLTPMLRKFDWVPGIGYRGGRSGDRRVFMRWGKQATEVSEGWLQKPVRTLMNKSSSVSRTAWEQTTGLSTGLWDLPFKDTGFTGVLEVEGSFWDSRAGFLARKFVPFSLASVLDGRSSIPTFFAPVSRGASFGSLFFKFRSVLEGYANPGVWGSIVSDEKKIEKMRDLTEALIDAAKRNGVEGKNAFFAAAAATRKEYEKDMLNAINKNMPKKQEQISESVIRLNEAINQIVFEINENQYRR